MNCNAHCYFKFNEKITSTSIKIHNIDFQNDGKCVFAPPTKYYDENNKLYQYLHMAKNDIQNMSNEYCEHLLNAYYNNQNNTKNKETKEEKKQTIISHKNQLKMHHQMF